MLFNDYSHLHDKLRMNACVYHRYLISSQYYNTIRLDVSSFISRFSLQIPSRVVDKRVFACSRRKTRQVSLPLRRPGASNQEVNAILKLIVCVGLPPRRMRLQGVVRLAAWYRFGLPDMIAKLLSLDPQVLVVLLFSDFPKHWCDSKNAHIFSVTDYRQFT